MDVFSAVILVSVLLLHCFTSADGVLGIVPDENFYWNRVGVDSLVKVLIQRRNYNVAKNVIFFIGDGMGLSTVTATRILKGQKKGQSGEEESLVFDRFPHVGLIKTYNTDAQVPDSAGTATSYMCGVKTNIGAIGVNEFASKTTCRDLHIHSVDSIIRRSIHHGKMTGIVTTTSITHGTPAAGYAHVPDRTWFSDSDIPPELRHECEDIASQLITKNNDINVLLGGGRLNFMPTYIEDTESGLLGRRSDGRNLIKEWLDIMNSNKRRHEFVWNKKTFDSVNPERVDYLFGMFEPDHLQYEGLRKVNKNDDPSLEQMVEKAIQVLQKGKNGFTLFVEGGRIDQAHHESKAALALEEGLELNRAIEKALGMVDLSDTLVVVSADHSHTFTIGGYPTRGNPILGLVDRDHFELEPSLDGLPYLTLGYGNGPGPTKREDLSNVDTAAPNFVRPSHVPLHRETHGGEDVAIYAIGAGSYLFEGVQEQNYIAHAISYASCIGHTKLDSHCYWFKK